MSESDAVRAGVRAFVLENFLVGESPDSLRDSTLLLTTGVISSLAMMELVTFLEDKYSITLREDDLSPDRLDSIDLIVDLVHELGAAQTRAGCQPTA